MSDNYPPIVTPRGSSAGTLAPLIRRDRRPLREVVREDLRSLISAGRFAPGEKLPAEPELAEMLGVSRGTLREAVRALELEGRVTHRRGVGTFVASLPFLRNNLDSNFGVTQLIESMGLRPGIRWMDVRRETAGQAVASRLGIDPIDPVVIVERVRTADDKPVVYSVDIMPGRIAQSPVDLGGQQSIYGYLRDRCGLTVQYGVARLAPAVADRRIARLLGVRTGSLLLVIDQVDYTADGRPVLYSLEYHLSDAFEVTVFRKGPGPGPLPAREG